MACAAFATQGLHMGLRPIDWLIGMALLALPMLVLFVVLRLASAIWTRLLRFIGRRVTGRSASLLDAVISPLRVVGHPLFATTVTIVWAVWDGPVDGPLALYHSMFFFEIPVAAGMVVGTLLGVGSTVPQVGLSRPTARLVTTATVATGLVIALVMGSWAALPGLGDPIVVEASDAVATVPQLDLPDPSSDGPYAVEAASYGSGTDGRRPEYGSKVDWVTPTVDASKALPARQFPDDIYASWFWGFDDTHLPLNALVWYPTDAPGRMPLAVIVHGNHDAGDYWDPGYAYLGQNLASHGIITVSIDENFLNGDSFYDYAGSEMAVRAWFLLRHLDQLRTWDATPGNPLYGRVDLGRVALMGHSRGGEAATLAAALNENAAAKVAGLPEPPRGFGIRAVVAIAPSDGMYKGTSGPATPSHVDYLLLEGARDADLPAFTGLWAYHRINVDDSDHLKAAVYVGRANHGRFNSVWDYGDAGPLSSWLLDRGSLLSREDQQRAAKTVIGAFLARSLQGQTAYDAFFRDPRSGRAWLPEDVVESHWQSGRRVTVDGFASFAEQQLQAEGFTRPRASDTPLRDGTTQHDRAAWLTWSDVGSLTVPVGQGTTVGTDGYLVFAMAPTVEASTTPDVQLTLTSADGTSRPSE